MSVPAELLLTFRLEQPLRTGVAETGYTRNGIHYHQAYGSDLNATSTAYREGLQAGRADWNLAISLGMREAVVGPVARRVAITKLDTTRVINPQ